MATVWTTSLVCINSSQRIQDIGIYNHPTSPGLLKLKTGRNGRRRLTKLKAGFTEIEPDLNEDPKDRWATPGVTPILNMESMMIITHSSKPPRKAHFWGAVAEEYALMDPPSGFQGLISWLFLPAIAAGMYFNAPGEYLYIGAGLFVIVFCIIEMDKPDKPHNFEPQIYNMERGARDKLISEYNTMDIWDFNEKYEELWDFTVTHDDIIKKLH